MPDIFDILYVDLGGVAVYSCDKPSGRILGWARQQNKVYWFIPQLIQQTAKGAIDNYNCSDKIRIASIPFSQKITTSSGGIIFAYFLRLLFAPFLFFKKIPYFDIAYSNSPVLVDIAPILWLKIFGKCKHWVLIMDSIVPSPSKRSGSRFINAITYWESWLVTILARFFALAIFTVNPELKKEIVRRGVKEEKVFLTQNGLFMERINQAPRVPTDFDAVYMGRITENKGVFDLLSVWAEVIKTKPDVKLAIMGTSRIDVVEKFVNAIKINRLENNINYLGFVSGDEKYGIFKASRIFVFLSKVNADESWGISLMEALACGLPAITYDLEIYKHIYPESILLKSPLGDIGAVIESIVFLLNNNEKRRLLSDQAAYFAKQFDWFEIANNDLAKICQAMTMKKSPRELGHSVG